MHELAITKYIVDTVLQSFDERTMEKIEKINLVMGGMRDYESEWLQKYFDGLTEDTPLEGAKLELRIIPVSFKCRKCGHIFPMDLKAEGDVGCPGCGSYEYDMYTGREFMIESIEAVMREDEKGAEEDDIL